MRRMARSMRSTRRLPLKYSEDEYVLQSQPRKTRNKISAENDAEPQSKGLSSVARIRNTKGNLNDEKRTFSMFGSPVLRDRTNLAEPELNVDILMKKGTNDERSGGKKPTNSTKDGAASTALEIKSGKLVEIENNKGKTRSTSGARNNLGKKVAAAQSASPKKSMNRTVSERKRSLRRSVDAKGSKASAEMKKKKFFTNKAGNLGNDEENKSLKKKKTIAGKQKKIVSLDKSRMSNSFRLRQTTLKESFLKQSAKKLRPRKAVQNYCEVSTVDKDSAKPQEEPADGVKRPIYKTAKFVENCENNGSEIYEFEYNSNDSVERMAKKKKKKKRQVGKNIIAKKSKVTAKKLTTKTRATVKSTVVAKKPEIKEAKIEEKVPDEPQCEPHDELPVSFDMQNDVEISPIPANDPAPTVNTAKKDANQVAKPIVVESVQLTGDKRINLDSTPKQIMPSSGEAREVKATSTFKVQPSCQYKTMMNHALLNKSLSPISKAANSFDPGSPWRAPSFTRQQFSRVNSVVQSTPQVRDLPSKVAKPANGGIFKKKATNILGAAIINKKLMEKNYENVNPSSQQIVEKPTPTKPVTPGKSPRKFGTEISNVNVSNAGAKVINESSDESGQSRTSLPLAAASAASMNNFDDPAIISARQDDAVQGFDDNADDKENAAPICASPTKENRAPKSPRKLMTSPLRAPNKPLTTSRTNFEPQPGPSGLQKPSPLSESRILKQSNLNNFLNLERMPTSTRITTIHGIFDDAHSTPINGKPISRKITTKDEPNVENAFGFDEDDEGVENDARQQLIGISPIKPVNAKASSDHIRKRILTNVANKKVEENNAELRTARLSIGEIKKCLQPKLPPLPVVGKNKVKAKSKPVERVEGEENVDRPGGEEQVVPEFVKMVKFSDTFDLSIDNNEVANNKNMLFADLEPVHFKQPPRHLYKRKRTATCNTSYSDDEEEDSHAAERANHGPKRRKISKVEKQRQKQLEEWAKGLNDTFEEIDHFDLVVE